MSSSPESVLKPSAGLTAPVSAKTAAPKRDRRDLVAVVVVSIAIGIVMQVASGFVPDYILPSPTMIGRALVKLMTNDSMHVAITLGRLAAAIVFSMVVGVAMGLLMATSERLGPFLRALVIIDTGIPALSWMLVAVFWFRDPESRIFFILTVILLPFYALNVYEGVRSMSSEWLDMLESFRPTRWQTMRYLIVPHTVHTCC